jgi:hypothetical protein
MDWTDLPLEPHHVGEPSSASKTIFEPMVCLAQTVHLSYTDTNTVSKWIDARFHMTHVTYKLHRVCLKWFPSLMVHSTQTVHLSCVKISTISKRTETSFHLSLVTYAYHQVHPKQFLMLWYVWCKPCTYIISRLALSPNGPKWASIWASSPSTNGCVQNDFWANGIFGANCAPYTDTNTISERTDARFHMTHVT